LSVHSLASQVTAHVSTRIKHTQHTCTERHTNTHTQVTYEIKAQMLEIYNESLRDLLVRKDTSTKLDILSTQASGCNVPNASKVSMLAFPRAKLLERLF